MKRLVNCSSYDFIKRSLCTVVAGAVVLSAASCNQLTSDQTKDSLNVNSEESSDTTSYEETSKAVNLTFEEVQRTVLEKLEYDKSDLKKPNEEDMIKNSYIGIVNLIRLNPPIQKAATLRKMTFLSEPTFLNLTLIHLNTGT